MITWDDFEKIEIRTGTIIKAEEFPAAKKPAYKLLIDFGESGIKTSSAQITALYQVADLLNKQVVAVVNFPARKIAGFSSECLILGVYGSAGVILIEPERRVENGSRIG